MREWQKLGVIIVLPLAAFAYWRYAIPEHRVAVRSELVMLGDLDGDGHWAEGDLQALEAFLRAPSETPDAVAWRLDLNQNGLIDDEDLSVLISFVSGATISRSFVSFCEP